MIVMTNYLNLQFKLLWQIDTVVDWNGNNNLEQEACIKLELETSKFLTQCVCCSVHTFQLCVEKYLKTASVNNMIVKARKVNNS